MNIDEIIDKLDSRYGRREWKNHHDPVSELILTILSQHTSDVNSCRAFGQLVEDFNSWGDVANADTTAIERSIRSAGLAKIKASRIRAVLQKILTMRGSLDLSFLSDLPLDEAKLWLEQLPGVGPKTAGCVLLFSLKIPALPVDTHIHRVAKRLGLIGSKVSADKAHRILEPLIPPQHIYSFHINLIEHGRRVCHAQNPKCEACLFAKGCPSSNVKGGKA